MLAGVKAAGLKLTPQRVAIVRELAGDPSHPTAQELFARLEPVMPTMSFATVYNTLDALASAGLCGSLSLAPGAARFDPNMAPHHHAVCERCGLVRDVPQSGNSPNPSVAVGGDGSALASSAPNPLKGFEVRTVEHIYRGLCAHCASLGALTPSKKALNDLAGLAGAFEISERVSARSKPLKKSLSATKRRST